MFSKDLYCRHVKTRPCLEKGLLFTTESRLLTTLKKKALENTVGIEENAGNQHFLLFPTVFSSLPQREIVILARFNLSSANALNLVMSKILLLGEGINNSLKKSNFYKKQKFAFQSAENNVENIVEKVDKCMSFSPVSMIFQKDFFSVASKVTIVLYSVNLINPLPDDKFKTLPNSKSLQTTILNLRKMAESSSNG